MISLSSIDYASYRSLSSYGAHTGETASKSEAKDLDLSNRTLSQVDQEALSTRVHVRLTRAELYQDIAQKPPENPYAATILSGISAQLSRDAIEGASNEDLQSRWQAGLDGFIQGFNEAKDQLQAIGALGSDVSSAINDTYDRVLAGLEEQAEKYGLDSQALEQYRNDDEALAAPEVSANAVDMLNRGSIGRHVESLATQRDFSFQLRTADGDLVLIEVAAAQAKALAQETNEQGSSLAYVAESSSSFSFSVQGELDVQELHAINDLLSQVNKISDTFFNGNVQDAFNLALDVGYDSTEISSFALALSKTSVQQTSTYSPNSYFANDVPSFSERLAPVSEFADLVEEGSKMTAKLKLDQLLVSELTEQFAKANYGDRAETTSVKSFVEQFLSNQ